MDEETKNRISQMIESQRVFLFMKGTPSFPQCGFSARAVGILRELGVEFGSFNVFDDDIIREGIKEYGQWPTIPQLYVDKQLVGGSDIMMEMFEAGELKKLIER